MLGRRQDHPERVEDAVRPLREVRWRQAAALLDGRDGLGGIPDERGELFLRQPRPLAEGLDDLPNILRLYCGSGSALRTLPLPKVPWIGLSMLSVPCIMYGHLPVRLSWFATRPCSRNVTRTVHPSRPYADAAYGFLTW